MTDAPRQSRIYAQLVLVAVMWGGTFIAGRIAAAQMTAPMAAFWRYVIATVILLTLSFGIERGLPRLSRKQWVGVCLLGASGVTAYNLFFMFGMETVSASRGSLIIATVPAATLLGGALFLHEPLTLRRVAGVLIALLGVAIELGHGNPLVLFSGQSGIGEVALFGGVLSWAAYTLIGKRLLTEMSPLAATTYAALTGTAMLALVCAVNGDLVPPQVTFKGWMALAYMGIFGTAIAFIWFYEGVRAIGPARSMVFVNLVPIFAIAFAMLLLGEKLELSMVTGAAFVVAGVFIINWPDRTQSGVSIAPAR
jgi:drug/metabolite transporter (DMT)-like permease